MKLDELEELHAKRPLIISPPMSHYDRFRGADYFKTGDISKESYQCINSKCSDCRWAECKCLCHTVEWMGMA